MPNIKRIIRNVGKQYSTPDLSFELYLNMKTARYNPDVKLTQYRVRIKYDTPDDISVEETERKARELNLTELVFEAIREEYTDARLANVRGQTGIHTPVLRGSIIIGDSE